MEIPYDIITKDSLEPLDRGAGGHPESFERAVDGRENARRIIHGSRLFSIDSSFISYAALQITVVNVVIGAGSASGSATVPSGSSIIGYYPVSFSPPTGQIADGIVSIAISGTTLTITMAANVGNASTFAVVTMI